MTEVFHVKQREERGSRRMRRLRENGQVPAVLYGHDEANLNLAVPADEVAAALRHGARVVELQGDVTQSALIRDVQWDAYGQSVMHMDLYRVEAGERVESTISVELRGEAPGVKEGGVVEHVMHEVEIECPAASLPERIVVNLNSLQLGGAIHASDLELPAGATLVTAPNELIVHCVEPAPLPSIEEGAAVQSAEPEVIGRKPGEEGEGE